MINSIPSIWGPKKMVTDFKRLVVSRLSAFTDFPCCILCHTEDLMRVTPHVITLSFCNKCQKIEFYGIEKHLLSHFTKSTVVIAAWQAAESRADAFKDSPTAWAT